MWYLQFFKATPCLQWALVFWLATLPACGKKPLAPVGQVEVASVGLNTGALSDDAEYAVVSSIHHGASLWRLSDGERLYNWAHQEKNHATLIAADFSPGTDWAVTAEVHTIALWELATGQSPRFWTAPGDILSIALARNGTAALLGLSDHTAVLFDIRRGGILRTLTHNNRVRSVALSDDSQIAVTGSEDYAAIAWDLTSGKPLTRIEHKDDVQLVAVSKDGTVALSASKYDKALVWETKTGSVIGEVPLAAEHLKRGMRFTTARFNSDNTLLVTGRPDQRITLWKLPELTAVAEWEVKKRKAWKPSGAAIMDLAFVPGTQAIYAVVSNGFVVRLEY